MTRPGWNRIRWGRAVRLLVAVGALLLAGWIFLPMFGAGLSRGEVHSREGGPGTEIPGPEAAVVEVAHVARADLSLTAEATGYLKAWREVEVSAERSGRVIARGAEEGDRVAAGDLLVTLDATEAQIEVEEAHVELLKARAAHAVDFEWTRSESAPSFQTESASLAASAEAAAEALRKAEQMYADGLISKLELLERRSANETAAIRSGARRDDVRRAIAGVPQAEQRLARARLALQRTEIRAPFAGRIADAQVELGGQVAANQILLLLVDDTRFKVDVRVLESDFVWLRENAPAGVRIPALEDRSLTGTIYAINPKVDTDKATGRVTIALENSAGLLTSGLFARVELETRRLHDRLVVPRQALLERQGRELAFRVENGLAVWTYVVTGARTGSWVEILDGLEEEDVVAVSGHFSLAHEAPVEVAARAVERQGMGPGTRPRPDR